MTSSNSISSAMMVLEFAVLLAVFIACARLKGVHPVTKLLYLMWIATLFISPLGNNRGAWDTKRLDTKRLTGTRNRSSYLLEY